MQRRLAGLFILLLLRGTPAAAQILDTGSITAVSSGGACSAAPAGCAVFILPIGGQGTSPISLTLQVSGTYSGTLAFEATSDNSTWFSISGTLLSDGSSATGTTTTGQYSFQNSGLLQIRVRATAWTSGTATITAVRGYASARWLSPFFTRVYSGDGTAALPAHSFSADTDTGVYRIGADNVGFSAGGTLRWDYNTTRILTAVDVQLGATNLVKWGTTSSFPALKRSSAALQVRVADDSGYGDIQANNVNIQSNLTVPTINFNTAIGGTNRGYFEATGDGIWRMISSNQASFGRLCYGLCDSGSPALKRVGNAIAHRLGDDTVPAFASLTACASGLEGAVSPVTDSSTATWGATVTGGGANHVLAYCNGTNWTVIGK